MSSLSVNTNPVTTNEVADPTAMVNLIMSRANQGTGLKYPKEQVEYFAERLLYWSRVFSYDTRAAFGQIMHETGFFHYGGDVKPDQYNFAGLGATGGVPGLDFFTKKDPNLPRTASNLDWKSSIDRGLLAYFVHLNIYFRGKWENWNPAMQVYKDADPRYAHTLKALNGFVAQKLQDLNGRWAYPGTTYAQMIVETANLLPGGTVTTPCPIPLIIDHIPWSNDNNPKAAALPSGRPWITVHETSNYSSGADAKMHRDFVHNGGGTEEVSFTYTIDDTECYELLPRSSKSWQAGDGANGPGNSSTSIETCVNVDGNWNKTLENLAQFLVWLPQVDGNLSTGRICQHNKWSEKNCPLKLRKNNGLEWNRLMERVKEIESQGQTGEVEPALGFQVGSHYLQGSIAARWQEFGTELALAEWGYPISGEFVAPVDAILRHVQAFERGWVAKYPKELPHGVPVSDPSYVRTLFMREAEEARQYAVANGLVNPDVLLY